MKRFTLLDQALATFLPLLGMAGLYVTAGGGIREDSFSPAGLLLTAVGSVALVGAGLGALLHHPIIGGITFGIVGFIVLFALHRC